MTDYTAAYTIEKYKRDVPVPALDDLAVKNKNLRVEPGQTIHVDIGDVRDAAEPLYATSPEPCESWAEAAYHAHRLSDGRKKALRWIAKHCKAYIYDYGANKGATKINVGYRLRYSNGRGKSASIINSLKGLAKDGLVLLDHNDGAQGWSYKGDCTTYIVGVTDRAMQYAHALALYKRPVGRIPAETPVEEIAAKLTPKTIAALDNIVKTLSSPWHGIENASAGYTFSIIAPTRKTASTYTALEKRGFLRWVEKVRNDDGKVIYWRAEIPKGSRMIEVAAYASGAAADALLTEGEG